MKKLYTAIGLMSGTSLDGIDCALLETDGYDYIKPLDFLYRPYDAELKERLRLCFGHQTANAATVRDMTLAHAAIVRDMCAQTDLNIDIIGFHGQTIYHAPDDGITVQMGDSSLLARETGIPVVADLRSNDVKHGGQGAPLAPLYHAAMAKTLSMDLPVVLVNIGGVSNVTYIDADTVIASDTGPGNALMDDFIMHINGAAFDKDGAYAASGSVDHGLLAQWMQSNFFQKPAPKSLDRDAWSHVQKPSDMSDQDYMATLLQLTVDGVLHAARYFPQTPKLWVISGGGRHNAELMRRLKNAGNAVQSIDDFKWDGDAVEAELFAYLAVRHLLAEPLSLPTTTGVSKPVSGGVYFKA